MQKGKIDRARTAGASSSASFSFASVRLRLLDIAPPMRAEAPRGRVCGDWRRGNTCARAMADEPPAPQPPPGSGAFAFGGEGLLGEPEAPSPDRASSDDDRVAPRAPKATPSARIKEDEPVSAPKKAVRDAL